MSRLWEKGLPLDERVLRYTAGEDHRLDARLVHYDVLGSIAHVEMLAAQGLVSTEDCESICNGLRALEASFDAGEWRIGLDDEDVHTALETRLTHAIGAALGSKYPGVAEVRQGVQIPLRHQIDAAAVAAVAAVGAAEGHVFLAPEAQAYVAALAGLHANRRLVYELHVGSRCAVRAPKSPASGAFHRRAS